MNEEDFHWYDLWTDGDGNIAYVKVNIDPQNMIHLEKEFAKKHKRKEDEEDEEYVNRFLAFLGEDDNIVVTIFNRPWNSINVHHR